MGQKQSAPSSKNYNLMFDSFSYAPSTTHRTEATYHARFQGENLVDNKPAPLLNTAYYGLWTMYFTTGVGPSPRIGQCSVYDPETDSLIIAYGVDSSGNYLNDCWGLRLDPLEWRLISSKLLSPRAYSSSVLHHGKMFIFGGACENKFFDDLHFVDLKTGKITVINIEGSLKPSPRTSPALFSSDHHIYMWSGYDGRAHGGIYRIRPDGSPIEWHKSPKSSTGIPAPSYCEHKGEYYVFGGVTGTPLAKLDPIKGEFKPIPCIGVEPTHDLSHAALVSADEFIFLIGGEHTTKFMHIFALDVKRNWWFCFNVRPDNNTLSYGDGIINKTGMFMLPREHSASVIYSPHEREIVSVMGSKMHNPIPVFKLKIGAALGVIHLRSDMLDLFTYEHGQNP